MKINVKKMRYVLSSLALLVVMIFGMALSARAARDIPTKVRSYPGGVNSISMDLEKGEYVKVTAAKGLKYKITYERWNTEEEDYNKDASATISYYTKKKGTYTIKYDVYSAATNTITASGQIKVFVQNDSPFKKVLVNGKDYYKMDSYFTTKKSIKFKVVMNKGYKFKKLELGTYGAPAPVTDDYRSSSYKNYTNLENEMTYRTVKNGAKVTLGNYGSYSLREYDYDNGYDKPYKYHYLSDSMTASTYLRVTYIDKYTKQEETTSFYFSKLR